MTRGRRRTGTGTDVVETWLSRQNHWISGKYGQPFRTRGYLFLNRNRDRIRFEFRFRSRDGALLGRVRIRSALSEAVKRALSSGVQRICGFPLHRMAGWAGLAGLAGLQGAVCSVPEDSMPFGRGPAGCGAAANDPKLERAVQFSCSENGSFRRGGRFGPFLQSTATATESPRHPPHAYRRMPGVW